MRQEGNENLQGGGIQEGSNSETTEHAPSMAPVKDGARIPGSDSDGIDDQGTDQSEASEILRNVRDAAFEGSDEKLALALGRPTEEIEEWTSGGGSIDSDVLLKARALADERGVELD